MAASGKEVILDELSMNITIPTDYVVFTRGVSYYDPNLELYGFTKDALLQQMKSGNIYLDAWDENVTTEIIITMNSSSARPYYNCTDTELLDFIQEMEPEYKKAGLSLINSDVYEHSQTKFIRLVVGYTNEYGNRNRIIYNTVYGSMAINISLTALSGELESADEKEIESIINSVVFDDKLLEINGLKEDKSYEYSDAETYSSGFDFAEFLINLILTVLLYSSPVAFYRYFIVKHAVEKPKAKRITIIYGIIAFIIMSIIVYLISGNVMSAGGAIFLWSGVNYKLLISGDPEKASHLEAKKENMSTSFDSSYVQAPIIEPVVETDHKPEGDDMEILIKYKEMLENELITQADYEELKKRILGL